jgi:hemoglobin
MKKIENRADIQLLVHQFYAKIRHDDLLGPIFNQQILDQHWPMHLDTLVDFWETNLFGIVKYKGSPTHKHQEVDKAMNYCIEQKHFGQWLLLWHETIDSLFDGAIAEKAKNSARKMSTGQYISIWQNRPDNKPKSNEE